jgi:hypothetical protein
MATAPNSPRDLVRVSDKRTGHHYTATRAVAEADPNLSILTNARAVNVNGQALGPVFKDQHKSDAATQQVAASPSEEKAK